MKERTLRLIGIPLLSIFFMLLYDDHQLTSWQAVLREFLVSFSFTFTLWEGNRTIVMKMRKLYPYNEQTTRRLMIQIPIGIGYTFAVTLLIAYFFAQFDIAVCHPGEWHLMALSNLIPTVFILSIYEGAYFFEEWKKNFQRSESLAKENIRSQFEVLKSQVDPHFLFNSLNTLSALIDPQNKDAQHYLEQLSDVYRYVLLSKQKETVSLREELEFVHAYIYLNKTRYRDNLLVQNDIPEESMEQRVAPLSLQILVENALKHNIISKDKPLTLSIAVDRHGYVVVENNIQKKNILEKSTKTGLENIVNRYALLTVKQVEISSTADLFSVRLPLITS
ncbi:histidine kinase [Catalinimonas sp. 4WD22]|uniref:sensor histidine kinase n=1 Tax=Catalinimonas locisalis TaxID=3133978 RepID=UPI00310198B4